MPCLKKRNHHRTWRSRAVSTGNYHGKDDTDPDADMGGLGSRCCRGGGVGNPCRRESVSRLGPDPGGATGRPVQESPYQARGPVLRHPAHDDGAFVCFGFFISEDGLALVPLNPLCLDIEPTAGLTKMVAKAVNKGRRIFLLKELYDSP